MNIVKKTSKASFRVFIIGLVIAVVSSLTLAMNWENVRAFASGMGIVNGKADSMNTSDSPHQFLKREVLLAPGTCDTAGPIEVEGSILGTTPTAYATLTAGFAAINAGTHTGAVTIDVCGDTSEGTGTALLNASGSGSASYTSITMSPAGGAARTISGATTAGAPMIDFSGADNVTINGLNTGGNSLTISNTTASATSGTSTIRFIGGATTNTITNSTILGSNSMAVTTNGGNIFFSTDSVTANGNDNNTISNNNIGPAGSNLNTKGIYFNGSTTTTAINNSGIIVSNNNIFDYFGAAVSSAGIYVNGGATDLTFSNNKFYQTATRTQTTGAQHSAIWISNTSGNNYQITGNTIGFGAANGTGTYNFVAVSSSSVLIPIFLSVGTTTATSVQNNTIAGIAMSGAGSGTSSSGPLRGIYVSSGLANIGDVTANTIGSMSTTGSITYTSSSASTSDISAIYNNGSSNWTVSNNNIGGFTLSNSSTGASNFYGIRPTTGTTVTFTCTNNTIGGTIANSIQSTTTSTSSQVVGIAMTSSTFLPIGTITGNTIRNMSAAGGTGTTTSASVIGILVPVAAVNQTIGQNTIFNLNNSNTTAATVVTGIQFSGTGTANIVERNLIYGLFTSTNSTTAEVNGIRVGGGTTVYRNNMIAIGASISNAIGSAASNSGTSGIVGINEALGTNQFFHNSVYVGGSPSAGTGASYAFNGVQTTNTRSFRDNIFFNARSNGAATGKNYAVKINGTAANPTGLTINNNVYFANGSGGVFGFFNSLDVANIAAWRTAVGQDANSFESNPQYLDPTNATPDLHINPSVSTVVEGNGADVGVTNDFDGQTRSGLTPVDIGADAGNFMGIDLAPPTITYTTLGNTTSTTDRTLSISVTDVSGVPTSGIGLPVLYFRKGTSGAYSSSQCVFVSGSNYNCTFTYASVGGVVAGDSIQYYVAAQDSAGTPNVTTNPATGASGLTANPPAASIPTTAPNSYLIATAITGTKTVCASGCDYTTLTAAGGVFASINSGVLTGNVNIEINGDLTTGEDGSQALNPPAEEPTGSNFTVKIYPTGTARAITSTTAPAGGFIRLNGADRVTIDGSIGGTGTDRSLTITEANTGTTSAVVWLQHNSTTTSDGAQNNTIKNLNVVGNSNTTTLIGIGMGAVGTTSVSTTSLGNNNNNNTIQNNNISKTQIGIYSQGASAANKNSSNIITQNLINTASPNNVAKNGIQVGFENNIQITQNNVSGMAQTSSPDVFGITLGISGISTSTFTGNEVTNATVSRNFIGSVRNTGTFSACGICVAPATSGTNAITNNMVSGVSANGTGGDFSVGILFGGGAGSTTQIYFNSVSMSGTQTGGSDKSFALAVGGSDPVVNIRNNILYNTQNNGTGNNYAIGLGYSTFTNLTSDYNDFFVTGSPAPASPFFTGGTGSISAPTNQATFANLQTATGKDANSKNVDPLFTSLTDLHLQAGSTLLAMGVAGTGITTDIDGDTRDAVPDVGADEIPTIIAPGVLQFSSTTYSGNENTTATITVTRTMGTTGAVSVDYATSNSGGSVGGMSCGAGVDYVSTSGTLMFADMQASNTFMVQLCPDAVSPEPGEAVTLTLTNATGGASIGANNPATLNITDVPPPLSGTYSVPGDFGSLTNAGGIFERLNNSGATGNIIINIAADLTGELGTNALNNLAGGYSVLIKPSGAARSITGTAASTALIRLNGANNVTIDGSLSGGTDRSLTIENTSATAPRVVRFGSIGTTPITNDVLKNCIIRNGTITASAVTVWDTGGATSGYFNNITIQNNDVQKGSTAIYTNAVAAAGNGSGLLITQNKLDTSGANAVGNTGIYVQGVDGATVSNNTIGNFENVTAQNDTGVWLATGTVNTTVSGNSVTTLGYTGTSANAPYGIRDSSGVTASGNSISNNAVSNITTNGTTAVFGIENSSGGTLINRNNVQGVVNTSTDTYGAYGINISANNNAVIRNNFVSNVTGNMTGGAAFSTTFGIFGIRIATGTGHQIYNNSVNLYGLRAGTATSSLLTAAFGIVATTSTGMDVRNNIFANNITGGTTSIANVSVYLPSAGTSAMNLTWNNNAYFWGTDVARAGAGQAGTTAGTNFFTTFDPTMTTPATNLRSYTDTLMSVTGNDSASQGATTAPPLVSNNDLHLVVPNSLTGAGAAIGSVTIDYDSDPRPGLMPDIGADEVVQASGGSLAAGTYYNAILGGGDVLGGNVSVTNNLTLTGISDTGANTLTIDCNATVSGAGATNYVIGNVRKNFCAPGSFQFPVGTTPNGSLAGEEFSPFTANVTTVNSVPSALTVSVIDGFFPSGMSTTQSASRYWDVTETGDLVADISFTYLDISPGYDVNGDETMYKVLRREMGLTNVYPGGTVNDMTNTATATGVSTFSQWAAGNLAPSAANVTVGGRVVTASGRGIYQARVVMIDPNGETRMARTNPFGYYRFLNVPAGNTYIFSAFHKSYQFVEPSIIRAVNADDDGVIFVASGSQSDAAGNQTYFDKTPFDFDGDGISDASVWRGADNSWYIRRSSDNTWSAQPFGLPMDKLAPADFDGDGITDLSVFRPSEGTWYILLSRSNSLSVQNHGTNGDVPMPTDFDGDGIADLAVWREAKNSFVIKQSSDLSSYPIELGERPNAVKPRTGDFDGNGKADIALFSNGNRTWEIFYAGNASGKKSEISSKGDIPVAADFDGDGRTDLGVFDSQTGIWSVRLRKSGDLVQYQTGPGEPVIGDFEGDGRIDAGSFSDGLWSVRQSLTGSLRSRLFGTDSDIPVPSAIR